MLRYCLCRRCCWYLFIARCAFGVTDLPLAVTGTQLSGLSKQLPLPCPGHTGHGLSYAHGGHRRSVCLELGPQVPLPLPPGCWVLWALWSLLLGIRATIVGTAAAGKNVMCKTLLPLLPRFPVGVGVCCSEGRAVCTTSCSDVRTSGVQT